MNSPPANFPNASNSTFVFNPIFGVPEDLELAFGRLYGCIGDGHNSVQGCAEEIYEQTYPDCNYQNCFMFADDLLLVMGTEYIDDYVRDSVNWSISYPPRISFTPNFDSFPEWVKDLVIRARAQGHCHDWHDQMQSAGCQP